MNKFSDFTNKNLTSFVEENKDKLNKLKIENSENIPAFNDMINKYTSMSSDDVFGEFLKLANQKKREGTLDLNYFNNVKSVLFPYLSEEQKIMFNNLMNYLR